MGWKKSGLWLAVGFLFALAVIGMNQNSFNPAKFQVTRSPLILDFADQKVRVIGWERDYASISVDVHITRIDIEKMHFAKIESQNGQIRLNKIKKIHAYIMSTWFALEPFKQYKKRINASSILELNEENVYTIHVPRDVPVMVHGRVLQVAGCRIADWK